MTLRRRKGLYCAIFYGGPTGTIVLMHRERTSYSRPSSLIYLPLWLDLRAPNDRTRSLVMTTAHGHYQHYYRHIRISHRGTLLVIYDPLILIALASAHLSHSQIVRITVSPRCVAIPCIFCIPSSLFRMDVTYHRCLVLFLRLALHYQYTILCA
jgi:hypothetical protein